ncbi:glycoside hydrolase family 3 protein [Oleiharenicola lentus]|uniref:Glycoside hydrolase family 3 protein n=1 Tax=Oleiharenicola lentus TaxID=2508720 RepID=A0A4Q1CCY0_9BACT|nr:glycoside hydrolase family 3 protein [Oleiharenicola lentus]
MPLGERVDDLVARLDPAEKIGQLLHDSPAIPRLGVPAYNWWNEGCHGVGRSGRATVFPQNIGLGATFDRDLVQAVGEAIATEARAKHHAAVRARGDGNSGWYQGLTFWTPNINLYRDPRWGRGQETFGEDPCLTGELGAALVRGLQGDDPQHLKVAACAKHFAVHSGPEAQRHGFDARVSIRDLRESYLPHFERVVRAGVEAVMGAYNRTNGEPCCASPALQRILREEWGFAGHFVSDCGAVDDFHRGHAVTPGSIESAALALRHGTDLNCGCTYNDLTLALRAGLVTEPDIDRALRRVLRTRFRLGLFDPLERQRFADIPAEVVAGESHRALAFEAAVRSLVLLKNNGVLPLAPSLGSAMVVGPGAASVDALLGNYFGLGPRLVTLVEGLAERAPADLRLGYSLGCFADDDRVPPGPGAVWECSQADVTIAVLGTLPAHEGEEGDAFGSPLAGDRARIELPASQRAFLEKLRTNGKPTILILMGGGPIACPEEAEWCDAILQAWYPGAEGGRAVAAVLFGDAEPGGRLPITVPRATTDLPPFEDYAMAGRTYRFATQAPLFPFGYGIGYTTWALAGAHLERDVRGEPQALHVAARNTGARPGRTVVQLYCRPPAGAGGPLASLVDFATVECAPGEARTLAFSLPPATWTLHDDDGRLRRVPGTWELLATFAAPVTRALELGVPKPEQIPCSIS